MRFDIFDERLRVEKLGSTSADGGSIATSGGDLTEVIGVPLVRVHTGRDGRLHTADLGHVSDDMAWLWQERGVRYFDFVDGRLLRDGAQAAARRLVEWGGILAQRGVELFGVGLRARFGELTPDTVDAAAQFGTVRLTVELDRTDVDNDPRTLRAGGCLAESIQLLRTRRVASVSQLVLVHPESTAESIARGISLLEAVPAGLIDATEMMADPRGDSAHGGEVVADPVAARFSEIFMRLHAEALLNNALARRADHVFLGLALAARLYPRFNARALWARMDDAAASINQLRTASYREALSLARSGLGFEEAAPLIYRTREKSRFLDQQLEGIELDLTGMLGRPLWRATSMKRVAGALLCLTLAGAMSWGAPRAVSETPDAVEHPRSISDLFTSET